MTAMLPTNNPRTGMTSAAANFEVSASYIIKSKDTKNTLAILHCIILWILSGPSVYIIAIQVTNTKVMNI
jgi:hypothetical protein